MRSLLLHCLVVEAALITLWTPTWAATESGNEDPVLAIVAGRPITALAFEEHFRRALAEHQVSSDSPADRRATLDRVVELMLLVAKTWNEMPDVARQVADSTERYEAVGELWRAVQRSLHPPAEALTDAGIAAFRDERSAIWFGRQIVTSTLEEANAAMARLAAGESFGDVAEDVSIDVGTAAAGGRIWPLRYGDWYPAVIDLVFRLHPGQYGGPVLMPLGYYLAQCDSIRDELDSELDHPDEKLRELRCRFEVLGKMDAWVADAGRRLGVRVREPAIDLVLEHLRPQHSGVVPPDHDPGWQPPSEPLGVTAERDTLTVADFFELFPALGADDWPRSGNRYSIRTSAERMIIAIALLRQWRGGQFDPGPEAAPRVRARVDRAVGDYYFSNKIRVSEVDSTTAEELFASRPDAFTMPETASISALGIATGEQAAEVHGWLEAGMPFEDAVEKAREAGYITIYAASTPLFPRGGFPESDELIFSLEPGEFTEPVPNRDGYQIYRLLQKRPPRRLHRIELSLDDLTRRARDVLSYDALHACLAGLRREFPVEIHDDEVDRVVGPTPHE